jgi:D-alanyl-D-alanine dipeptidase
MIDDFVYVDEAVPGIRWDARYATADNFTGAPVDGYLANRVIGTKTLCVALELAQEKAESIGFGLLLWDGYRPQRAVDAFLRWSRSPGESRTKAKHHPNLDRSELFERGYVASRSGHTRGSAIDLTLFRLSTGEPVPMGGDHDLMDPVSHHGAPGITAAEARNRHYLRSIMWTAGFDAYEREWWHYLLRDEPHPDTYYDFPVA